MQFSGENKSVKKSVVRQVFICLQNLRTETSGE